MKISSLFSLLTNATGFLDFFEGIDTREQLVSRLERLKHQGTEELLDSIYTARGSIEEMLDDTIETSAPLEGPDETTFEDTIMDEELENLASNADEKQIPPEPPAPENEKT